ncbi:MAG: amino acid adenylation domain-containing protein, partial [Dissulfurispiraceae bacterium]
MADRSFLSHDADAAFKSSGRLPGGKTIDKRNIKNIYGLSPLQEGMLFHQLFEADSQAYFQQMSYRISGRLDVPVFEKSWNELLRRHDSLRTVFVHKNVPEPLQVVLKERTVDFRFEDRPGLAPAERDAFIEDYKQTDRKRPFILSSDVLMRVSVLGFGDDSFEVVWSFPHIIMDGWCMHIVQEELFEIYRAFKTGIAPVLPEATPYSAFIKWLGKRERESSKKYWKEYLADYQHLARLPGKRPPARDKKYDLNNVWVEIERERTGRLVELASRNRVTLNTVVQCLWGIMLAKYNNTDDTVFGMTVSGRPHEIAGIERMVGLFINTLPVRIRTGGMRTFRELLMEVHAASIQGRSHHYYPLTEIQAETLLRQDLFDHIMVFENYPANEELAGTVEALSGLAIDHFSMFEQTNYAVEISVFPGDTLMFRFGYDAEAYDSKVISAIGGHLKAVIDGVLENEEKVICDIEIVSPHERHQILNVFNNTSAAIPPGNTVVEMFENQAAMTPDTVAVVCEDRNLTYRELDERANVVAHHLIDTYALRPDDLAGVMADRSERMLIGMLGIMKAGAAYVPIDPDFPAERIDYILINSACKVVLAEEKYIARMRHSVAAEFCDFVSLKGKKTGNPPHVLSPDNLAYTIYTSGSTGDPKGVMVTHRNVTSFNLNLTEVFGLRSSDTLLALTTITFDISVLELINSLLTGIKVVISTDAVIRNPEEILRLIRERGISVLQVTPSRLRMLLAEGNVSSLRSLRVLLIGGEPLSEDLFGILQPLVSDVDIFNVYGPTETTIWSTSKKLNDGKLTIGSPLLNETVYILSKEGRLMPPGVIGEICIGGCGVARGYYRLPELTAGKFIAAPFNERERIYLTGDIGRFLPDGQLECLGRNDDQVKIRGYRVEPAEIEQRVKAHPGIKGAVVVPRELSSGSMDLVAYCIGGEELGRSYLREYLGQWLPEYLLPSYFVFLERFPLTPNGKIDKKALPLPEAGNASADVDCRAPETGTEMKVAEIWREAIGRESVGLNDDFFEMGGHSLKAIRIISRIYKIFGVDVSLKEFFGNRTIGKLSGLVHRKAAGVFTPIGVIPERPQYDLSHAQRRLWILDRMEEYLVAFNIPGAYLIEGELDAHALNRAFQALVERHESLRTTFEDLDGVAVQKVRKDIGFALKVIDLSNDEHEDKVELARGWAAREAALPFDLSEGPLLRATLIRFDGRRSLLSLVMHHIISDGWSFHVLERELAGLYRSYAEGTHPGLLPLTLQYRDYAVWQNNLLQTEMIREHREYWRGKLSGELPPLDLPSDLPRPRVKTFNGKTISFEMDDEVAAGLRVTASRHGASLFMLLVTALKVLLYRYTGQQDIIIGTPVAGRNHPDLENQIGFYVNILALRDTIKGSDSFETLIRSVKQTAIEAYDHQDYPFDMLVDELDVRKETGRSPLFDVMIALQHDEHIAPLASGLKITGIEIETGISQYDITIEFKERRHSLSFALNY